MKTDVYERITGRIVALSREAGAWDVLGDAARPDVRVDVLAVPHRLHQPRLDELLQVMRDRRLRDRNPVADALVCALVLRRSDGLQHFEATRIRQRLPSRST